jgi:hypothetical protein
MGREKLIGFAMLRASPITGSDEKNATSRPLRGSTYPQRGDRTLYAAIVQLLACVENVTRFLAGFGRWR